MGNLCTGEGNKSTKTKPTTKRTANPSALQSNSSNRWTRIGSARKDKPLDDDTIREQALAAAILFQQRQQQNGSMPFGRSTSLRYPNSASKNNSLPRSTSTRPRSRADPLLQPQQLVNQNQLEELETKHFFLVHGGGFGAWCWYKTIALLEEAGFKVSAIDLAGSGIHSFDTSNITSLSQYVKPLTDFLSTLADDEKVILVGHDFGGTCISYAMELFPQKISKAVFVAATMLSDGQSALDIFSQQVPLGSNNLMHGAQIFLYANGNDKSPTAIDLDKSLLKELLFNHSPSKDVALASVSMRPIPFAPVLEKVSLSESKYGSVRRFYIETLEDNAIPVEVQETMIDASPPELVFHLKGIGDLVYRLNLNRFFHLRQVSQISNKMGRGVSCGGGQSSLGYMFGSGESNVNVENPPKQAEKEATEEEASPKKFQVASQSSDQVAAGTVPAKSSTNNYQRAEGQNCGNFITDRPSTKVHAAPGGGSSLGYLFGDEKK